MIIFYCTSCEHVLVYNDVRKFGPYTSLMNPVICFAKGLGPEPMSEGFNSDYLFDKANRRTCSVKELIMNQRVVVGIGNIYTLRHCFFKIHPLSSANKIPKKNETLVKNKTSLIKAISMEDQR